MRATPVRAAIYLLDRHSGEWLPVQGSPSRIEVAAGWIGRAVDALRRATDFAGRVDRGAFLGAMLVALMVVAAARAMDWLVFGAVPGVAPAFFVSVAAIGLSLPLLAASVRRLNDTGRSGWWMLLAAAAPIGWLPLVFMLFASRSRSAQPN